MRYIHLMRRLALAVALLAACDRVPGSAPRPGTDGAEKVKVIARGTPFDAKDYTAPGFVVILEFGADW